VLCVQCKMVKCYAFVGVYLIVTLCFWIRIRDYELFGTALF